MKIKKSTLCGSDGLDLITRGAGLSRPKRLGDTNMEARFAIIFHDGAIRLVWHHPCLIDHGGSK